MSKKTTARLLDGDPFDRWCGECVLDELGQPGLGLGAGQALAGARRADRSEPALHESPGDAPLPVVTARALEDAAGPV